MLTKLKNSELAQRLKSETPDWFKNIRKRSVSLTGVAGSLLAADGHLGFNLPAVLHAPCTWLMVAGISMAAISTTAKKDTQ